MDVRVLVYHRGAEELGNDSRQAFELNVEDLRSWIGTCSVSPREAGPLRLEEVCILPSFLVTARRNRRRRSLGDLTASICCLVEGLATKEGIDHDGCLAPRLAPPVGADGCPYSG